ncbi:GP179 protein, partial [Calyptomena viridis]|nr:GP179 protein [Calyptomena viridis]
PSTESQSTEGLKAEVCPWEAQEPKSSDKAEICPWEVAEPPSHQQQVRQVPGGGSKGDKRITRQAALGSPDTSLGKGSTDRDTVCPWETQGPSGTSHVESPGLPKSPAGKSQSTESLKAEVCPWEAQEPKSSDKAEICPWESTDKPHTRSPALPKSPSKKSQSTESL